MRGLTQTLALALASASASARADVCPPAALLYGDPDLVEASGEQLRLRGVGLAGERDCRVVVAVVVRDLDGERVRVTVTDPDGRSVERVAEDVAGAATAIEAWARRDVSDPLLAARDAPVRDVYVGPETSKPAATANARAFDVAAGFDGGVSYDGALWRGVHAQVAAGVGPFLVGGMFRWTEDTGGRGDPVKYLASRSAIDLLVVADAPIRRGRFAVVPGVGVGQTTVKARRPSGEDGTFDSTEMLLRAGVGVGYRVTGAWSIRLDAAVGWAPWGDKLFGDPPEEDGDPAQVAGAQRMHAWLGLGIGYGR